LRYCSLDNAGSVSEKQKRLLDALEAEEKYKLMTKLVESKDYDSAFCQVEDAIPCIMHGGNRMGEKLFTVVMIEAWEDCVTKASKEVLIALVEHHVNTRIFGNAESKSQWKLPVTSEFEIDTVSFSAWRVQKVMDNLGTMVEVLMRDRNPDCVVLWQEMLQKYLDVMSIAFQHEDFSDEDIEIFQRCSR
jgi:hypothetical protein